MRLGLDLAVVAFGFIWVSWISPHDTWKGGVCIEIGVAFAVMELLVYLFGRWSLRVTRLAGYAVVAVYGVLAWMHNPVSRYLNSIGAVPHDRSLGRVLLWLALGLCRARSGALRPRRAPQAGPRPRRRRRLGTVAGAVVLCLRVADVDDVVRMAGLHAPLRRPLVGLHRHHASQPPGRRRPDGPRRRSSWSAPSSGWCLDLVGALGGSRPEHGRYEFTGITKEAKFAYGKTAITIAALLVAVQWPLHLDAGIQSILTTQVAIYVLLAMGLNVVVGFAGLLDLGYVAFWAIGAYTTAYFTGALPIKPPFILNPFWVIPFSIAAAMLTGVLLGTPTLRLRGDYLAIVTLGFGEIIEIVANNLNGVTGGPAGTPGFIPQFSVHLFSVNYRWTGTVLPYYYLILGGGGRLHGRLQFPRTFPRGTVVDGHPRRRGRGRFPGHQHA